MEGQCPHRGRPPQFDDLTMLCLEFRHYMKEETQ